MGKSFITSSIFAAILSTALVCEAAPLMNARSYSNTTATPSNTTMPSAPPAYTSQGVPYAQPIATVYPEYTSQFHSKTGAIDFHTERGVVSRSTSNNGADITTLVTFELDAQYSSNMCQLVFDLNDYSSYASGSKKAQLFTSLAPATADSNSWPSGNLRNQELGSIDIVAGGRSTWEAGSGPGATANGYFPCSAITGHIYGGEIVPQGDNVEVSWPAGKDGVKIIVY